MCQSQSNVKGHTNVRSGCKKDATKIWNEAPRAIKDCTSLHQAKKNKLKSSLKHYQFKLCKNCNFLIRKSLHFREINHYYLLLLLLLFVCQ